MKLETPLLLITQLSTSYPLPHSMGTSAGLPLEILGYIADVLGDYDPHRIDPSAVETLKMLCMTCKFMVPACRRHLFATVRFSSSRQRSGRNEFLLSNSIIILHYTKNLYLEVTFPLNASDHHCLQKICDASDSLTAIEILSLRTQDWNILHENTKTIILSLIQKPTLRRLTYQSIRYFPAAALSLCSGLEQLAFHGFCALAPPSSNDEIHSLSITTLLLKNVNHGHHNALTSLMNPTGEGEGKAAVSIIIPEMLKNVGLHITCQDEFPCVRKLLENSTCLEWLQIDGAF